MKNCGSKKSCEESQLMHSYKAMHSILIKYISFLGFAKISDRKKTRSTKVQLRLLFKVTSPLQGNVDSGLMHCNPLQGHYRVELLHSEIPVVITGNGFAVWKFLNHGPIMIATCFKVLKLRLKQRNSVQLLLGKSILENWPIESILIKCFP